MNTRPFDLAEYKASVAAGKPVAVATRRGESVTIYTASGPTSAERIVGTDGESVMQWDESGRFLYEPTDSDLVFTSAREFSDAECAAFCTKALGHSDSYDEVEIAIARHALQQIDLARRAA